MPGFTTIELLVVVAIASILAAMATPSLTTLIARQNAKSTGSELFFALLRTRSEAVARNTNLTLAPSTGGDWRLGWQLPDPANPANLLDSHGISKVATITGPDSVVYDGSGRIKGGVAPVFVIKALVGATPIYQCVSVDLGGRPYQKADSTC